MSNFRRQHKFKSYGFANVKESRHIRAEEKGESRKNQRATAFNENRNTSNSLANAPQQIGKQEATVVEDRLTRLLKWKAEREKFKKMHLNKKKPPFVVGVVHHKVYSPFNKDEAVAPTVTKSKKVCHPVAKIAPVSPVKRITRATEKRLKNKTVTVGATKSAARNLNVSKNEQPNSKRPNESFAPVNHKFQAPLGLSHIPLFGRVPLYSMSPSRISNAGSTSRVPLAKEVVNSTESTPEELNDSKHLGQDPVFFSPYVVASRGKSNARKEQQIKRGFSIGSPKDDIPTKETVMKNLNISVEEEERTAQYFQFLLNREIDRLNGLCDKWTQIKEDKETSEDGQYEINQAIGQTKLLISKKFVRFRGLVADCETGKGEMLVTCKDLQGFWDMMHMEVRDCDLRFEKLEKLRARGWVEEEVPIRKPVVKKKIVAKKKVVPTKSSAIWAFLAEKKKRMAEKIKGDETVDGTDIVQPLDTTENESECPDAKYKIRRSMSAGSGETVFTPAKPEKRFSLLQKVQLSEASKNIKSPLTIIKVSQMCKTPEIQLDNTISYVNSNQTPGKSILKPPKGVSQAESHAKSGNKVNFDDHVVSNEVPIDGETRTRMDLAAALSRIDKLDLDSFYEEPIKAERKLVFDDDSSDESELDNRPRSESGKSEELPKDISTSVKEERNEYHDSIKVLRSRTISTVDTPKAQRKYSRRMSVGSEESKQKENKTPSKGRRKKSSLKITGSANENIDLPSSVDNIRLEEGREKRRSTRSVKFAEKECSGCLTNTAPLPMTPHVRRSKAHSVEKKRQSIITEDLISWETPEKPPERVRRSQAKKV